MGYTAVKKDIDSKKRNVQKHHDKSKNGPYM